LQRGPKKRRGSKHFSAGRANPPLTRKNIMADAEDKRNKRKMKNEKEEEEEEERFSEKSAAAEEEEEDPSSIEDQEIETASAEGQAKDGIKHNHRPW